MGVIRVRGLIQMMNRVRVLMTKELSHEDAEDLGTEVQAALEKVRAACRKAGGGTELLSVQSRRAFQYLHSLSFRTADSSKGLKRESVAKKVNGDGGRRKKAESGYRVPGLAGTLRSFLNQLAEADSAELQEHFISDSGDWLEGVRARLEAAGTEVGMLSVKQQRQLRRLELYRGERPAASLFPGIRNGDGGHPLLAKLPALIYENAARFSDAMESRWPRGLFRPALPLVYWEPSSSRLWSMKRESGVSVLRCSDLFLIDPEGAAPDLLARSVAAAAAGKRLGRDPVRRWGQSSPVAAFMREIERALSGDRGAGRGLVHDLERMFDSINRRFFESSLPVCRLEWGQRRAHCRTGVYDPVSRTIRISPVLDSEDVPEYVAEFVLYHEMLHLAQDLGGELAPGRRIHTADFRRLERCYPQWDKAEAFLRNLARRH